MFDIKQTTHDYMSMIVTHACNRKCSFCVDAYRGRKEFISLEHAKAAVDFAYSRGIRDILLIGGEPTLHPDIAEIAKIVKRANIRCIMTTNFDRPERVEALDGIVDCFNLSYYGQAELPLQKDFESDLTLHTLIYFGRLDDRDSLDRFIDEHGDAHGHLKFSTLLACNEWSTRRQHVGYLDWLPCEWVVLFNELLGQKYRGTVIKRYDKVFNLAAHQSYKAHVDGTITQTWDRPSIPSNH